ncbi:neocarzinostatin apoprotein domain-containing protein [Nocardia macrotermitis]|uniref:Neocarzinostatin n=1 Tax=Nocardia macrotermitis TaxID=2585198 RepID=A0A7K0D595_9NOCA|nr:neocarzinostatin apoprotein domain-containing protein [Nocardia macrotermitis]MQY20897.1 hypothetical protein [Nocardia macrotermitis]
MFRTRTLMSATVAGLAVVALFGAAPAEAATLAVSQSGGVAVGQSISVSVSGLAPNLSSVAIGQCKSRIAGPSDCNLQGSLLGKADAQGSWHAGSITLVGAVGGVNCASQPGACTIAVTSLTDPHNILASVPLTFR